MMVSSSTVGGQTMLSRRSSTLAVILATATLLFVSDIAAQAQSADTREVFVVRQDESDCTNTTVPNLDSPNVRGTLLLARDPDGNTTVKVAITASPDTTYHFFLKCVRQLGDITTGDEGVGLAAFTFPTNTVGSTYAFDSYPEGAPLGNKFQSVTVKF
jgi:hypothetical protein